MIKPVLSPALGRATKPGVGHPASGGGGGGGATLAFNALTYDPVTYEMQGVLKGTGGLTTTHTATIYGKDYQGVYRAFGANQPVWSGGRLEEGPELFTNPNFTTDLTGWQSTPDRITWSAGTVLIDRAGSTFTNQLYQVHNLIIGREYKVSIDVIARSHEVAIIINESEFSLSTASLGEFIFTFTPTVVNNKIQFGAAASTAGTCQLDNASLKELHSAEKVFSDDEFGAPLPEVPWLDYVPAADNHILRSNNLTVTPWTQNTTVISAFDAVGLTGAANAATTLTDNDVANAGSVTQTMGWADVGDVVTTRTWIKKEASPTAIVALYVNLGGANSQQQFLHFETDTGNTAFYSDFDAGAVEVIDGGDWWIVLQQLTDPVGGSNPMTIIPADGFTLGARDVAATGSCIIGNVEGHLNKTIAEVRGLPPIFTTTASVATDQTLYSFSIANHNDSSGAYYTEYMPSFDQGSIPSIGCDIRTRIDGSPSGRTILVQSSGTSIGANALGALATGFNSGVDPADVTIKMACVYTTDDVGPLDLNQDGNWDLSVATGYTGFANLAGIYIDRTTNPTAAAYKIRNLQRYDISSYEEGKDKIDELMT